MQTIQTIFNLIRVSKSIASELIKLYSVTVNPQYIHGREGDTVRVIKIWMMSALICTALYISNGEKATLFDRAP